MASGQAEGLLNLGPRLRLLQHAEHSPTTKLTQTRWTETLPHTHPQDAPQLCRQLRDHSPRSTAAFPLKWLREIVSYAAALVPTACAGSDCGASA